MTHEEIEQKIIELERYIRAERKAWRIDYEELTERLDSLGVKNLTEIAKGLFALKEEVQTLKKKYDTNKGTKK
jgi:DNA gyrase/topoisomerase IV subunit A